MLTFTTKSSARNYVTFAHPLPIPVGEVVEVNKRLCTVYNVVRVERPAPLPMYCTMLCFGLTPEETLDIYPNTTTFYFFIARWND